MSSKLLSCIASGLLLLALPGFAETVTVSSQGTGHTREVARVEALKDAIMQVSGVSVDAETIQHLVSDQITVNDEEQSKLRSQQEQHLNEKIRGVVSGFRVLDESKDSNGLVRMTLEVDIEKYDMPGVDSNRRSISVQGFEAMKPGTCFNQKVPQGELVKIMTDAVQRALVTTRKFAILDRHGSAYNLEKEFIQNGDVKLTEQAKLSLNKGSDYIVSGKIRTVSISETRRKLQLSDRIQVERHARADVGFDLMLFATREIQLSSNVTVSLGENIAGLTCTEIVARLAEKAASEIARKAVLSIYPPTVINAAGRMIYFNYGGDEVHVGEIYNLYSKGEPIYDPYTKEPLGNVEDLVGRVQVVEVKPKYSVATWVDPGQRAPVKEGDILRPYKSPKPNPTPAKKSLKKKVSEEW